MKYLSINKFNNIMKESVKETIESVFNESGFDGLVQYFMESENLTIEDATDKANELGYGSEAPEVPEQEPVKEASEDVKADEDATPEDELKKNEEDGE